MNTMCRWGRRAAMDIINVIFWNGTNPKYDIRDWAPGREKMGKGVTLTAAEVEELKKLL